MIDCGHGGSDAGTVGCNAVTEKEITLAVGRELAQLLEKNDIRVVLTRSDDSTVALDDRTSYANRINADLFVSLHANNAASNRVQGVETYYFDNALLTQCFSSSDHFLCGVMSRTVSEIARQGEIPDLKKKLTCKRASRQMENRVSAYTKILANKPPANSKLNISTLGE